MVLFVIAVCYDLCTTFRTIFIIVRLVHKHPVYAELFKVNHIILAVAGLQLFQPRLQPLFRALQALDGKAVAACELGILNAIGDFLNLLMKEPLLPLRTDGDTLKLAVAVITAS